jgi:FMN-dependent NADH-azoreductase
MDKVLFINACIRPFSRTMELTRTLLEKLGGNVEELNLYKIPMAALDMSGMEKREEADKNCDFSHSDFNLAKQFAAADKIVIAAPYWDMMFPAVLKLYFENVTVSGVTFKYSEQGRPQTMCRAKELHYVTTAGGFIGENDYGFSYVKALAKNLFGITNVNRYVAEGLDIFGADADAIIIKAKQSILDNCKQN